MSGFDASPYLCICKTNIVCVCPNVHTVASYREHTAIKTACDASLGDTSARRTPMKGICVGTLPSSLLVVWRSSQTYARSHLLLDSPTEYLFRPRLEDEGHTGRYSTTTSDASSEMHAYSHSFDSISFNRQSDLTRCPEPYLPQKPRVEGWRGRGTSSTVDRALAIPSARCGLFIYSTHRSLLNGHKQVEDGGHKGRSDTSTPEVALDTQFESYDCPLCMRTLEINSTRGSRPYLRQKVKEGGHIVVVVGMFLDAWTTKPWHAGFLFSLPFKSFLLESSHF